MKRSTTLQFSAGLSIAAAILVATATFLLGDRLGAWQWLFYLGAGLALFAALVPVRQATWGRRVWIRQLLGRHDWRSKTAGPPRRGNVFTAELASLLEERLREVERRERELADRLASYHQWFEFPPPVDLAGVQPPTPGLHQRDRKLDALLEEKTRVLFEKVRNNEYSPQGAFQFALLRNDVFALVGQIAALYGDDPNRPLAGVSSERILRAASRCSLKFLVEIEKLPLDIRGYDLVDIYKYVRRAVMVYGFYRSASPYMPWLRGAYYGTSVAMGSNPLSLGAWWFLSSLGSRTATTVATNLANRWALNFLQDIVRVIGYEVASVYDKNLRYRQPNWCFAAELTELVQTFPASEVSLRRSLSLIGALQFQNEYDRIYFFRCIVEVKQAVPKRAQAADLPVEQRREIAERLEGFLESHIPDPHPTTVARWREGVEDRLDLSLDLAGASPERPENEQRKSAVRSLAGYLLEIKQAETDALRVLLEPSALVTGLAEAERPGLWRDLQGNPPFFFQTPDIVPNGDVAEVFLDDLATLAVRVAPRYPVADELVVSTAARLRGDPAGMKKKLDRKYVREVVRRLPEGTSTRWLPPDVARAVLDLGQDRESLHFIYGNVHPVVPRPSELAELDRADMWLVGVGERLVAFALADPPRLIWQGDRRVHMELTKDRFRGVCRLVGGRWLNEQSHSTPTLLLHGNLLRNRKRYFTPLKAFCAGTLDQPGS